MHDNRLREAEKDVSTKKEDAPVKVSNERGSELGGTITMALSLISVLGVYSIQCKNRLNCLYFSALSGETFTMYMAICTLLTMAIGYGVGFLVGGRWKREDLWSWFLKCVPVYLVVIVAASLRLGSSETLSGSILPSAFIVSRADVVDAWIAFLTWSTTYLFIRRYMNPENGNTTFVK